jgi:hypothetical protein
MNTLKAFQVDYCTWYAAETAEQAAEVYSADTGEACVDGYPTEVTDEMMDHPTPDFDENEMPTGKMTTMRAYLAEATAPGFLATSEY